MPTSMELRIAAMKSSGKLQSDYVIPESERRKRRSGPVLNIISPQKPKLLAKLGREYWSNFMVRLVRTKICLKYLSDAELKLVIDHARGSFARKSQLVPSPDPDLPECFSWNELEVADWLGGQGFSHFKEAFLLNRITGRRLIAVDANALIKMGLKNFEEIKVVSALIRQLLGIPKPSMMRALMRIVPYEKYLKRRLKTGKNYDNVNFELFCTQEDFPYEYLVSSNNKNAEIPCSVDIQVKLPYKRELVVTTGSGSSESSLESVPTVEFVARNVLVHNQVIQQLIEELLICVVEQPKNTSNFGKTMKRILHDGCQALNIPTGHSQERLNFVSNVAKGLIMELQRTTDVLRDIEETQKQVKRQVSLRELEAMRETVWEFMDQVLPLAALMSFGEFTLENIFRQQPDFEKFVRDITDEAELRMKEVLPQAEEIVNEVIHAAEDYVNTRYNRLNV